MGFWYLVRGFRLQAIVLHIFRVEVVIVLAPSLVSREPVDDASLKEAAGGRLPKGSRYLSLKDLGLEDHVYLWLLGPDSWTIRYLDPLG